jgi:TRAP-type C4-dicarboxylate transport system permease small subunit
MSDEQAPSSQKRIEELIFIKIPHALAGILFLVATAINIVNVIARYVFSAPVFWAEEVLVFLVIWTVFLVAGSITYRGAHLNMDLLYAAFPPAWKRAVNTAIWFALVVCTSFAAIQAWKIVKLQYQTHGVTAATDIPLVIPHSALLFGFSFMALAALVRVGAYISGKFD